MSRPEEVLVVVYRPGPEFLVALRSPERHGYWNPIAGGIEEGEHPDAAARRELAEESGLDPLRLEALPIALNYVRPEGGAVAVYAYLAEAPPGFEPVLDEEHVDYRWCSAAEADALLAYPEPREAYAFVAALLASEPS